MSIESWLKKSVVELKDAGITTARLDCLVLLEDLLNKDRTQLLAHSDSSLSAEQLLILNRQLKRRQSHEPLAYIRGKTEFYGREFMVSKDTLEPRPETETMIDVVKELPIKPGDIWADIGAGSGAIGITLALELTDIQVDMYEISAAAVVITHKNIVNLQVPRCRVYKNDLLSGIKTRYDVIVANLPYVPDDYRINQAAKQEPELAIFGGPDGLDIYRRLFLEIKDSINLRFVVTESLPFQHSVLINIAEDTGFKLLSTNDFIQVFSK